MQVEDQVFVLGLDGVTRAQGTQDEMTERPGAASGNRDGGLRGRETQATNVDLLVGLAAPDDEPGGDRR